MPACRTAHGSNNDPRHSSRKQDSQQVSAVESAPAWLRRPDDHHSGEDRQLAIA